jgi:hypothetical protein
MDSFFIDLAFSTLIALLRRLVTDPTKTQAYEKVFLKVFTLIWNVYQNDQRFQAAAGHRLEVEVE